jgi:hypothetical protein
MRAYALAAVLRLIAAAFWAALTSQSLLLVEQTDACWLGCD